MPNRQIIAITCRKGGVGKSSVCANLALFLAKKGHRTLLIDCDFGMRNQDSFFALAEQTLFDFADAATKRVPPSRAVLAVPEAENLWLCPAPSRYAAGSITKEAMKETVVAMAEELDCEFVLLDTPGAMSEPCELAISCADTALVVSSLQPAALRAAAQTNLALCDAGIQKRRLILNGLPLYYPDRPLAKALIDAINQTALQLIGVIPYDEQIALSQANEQLSLAPYDTDTATAFSNIVSRLEGENVPLFTGFSHLDRIRMLHRS